MSKKERRSVPVLRFKGFTDDWEQRKFTELGKLYYGKSAPKWSVVEKGGTPCIRYGELYTKYSSKIDNVYSHTSIDKSKLKFSTGNELLIPRVGEEPLDFAKHTSWLSIPNVAIGEMITVLKTKENPLFLANYLRAKYVFKFARLVEGGNVSNLYFERYEDTNILIPSKNEQQNISKLILKIDKLITLQQRKLDQFKQLKTMCLANMFFNSANHVTKLRFVGFTDNVEKQSFGNTISHKSGTSIEKYFSPKGQYKVISIGSYGLNGEYIDQGIRAVSNEKTNSHLIRKGELSMVLNDKTDGKILGRTLLINKDNEYVVNQRSEIIKPNPALWDTQFAFTYLNGPFRKKVIRIMQGGTQKYINFSSVEKLNVFLPEVQEQQKIGFLFKKIDAIICHHQQKILSLKQIRKFLLQNLFI